MIKTINTGVAELVLVKVPEDAHNVKCCFIKLEGKLLNSLTYEAKGYLGWEHDLHQMNIDMPQSLELLGIAHELPEEVWSEIVELNPPVNPFDYFKDYSEDGWGFDTATESGLSLLMANEVYFENPHQMPSHRIWQTDQIMYNRLERQYEQAQENTGKWVVLKNTNV